MKKELSLFVDESGDFGEYNPKAPYYIIGIVLHNQATDISSPLKYLETSLKQVGFTRNCVHIGPLIRREQEYIHLTLETRKRILYKMMAFAKKADFSYKTFIVEKKHIDDSIKLATRLATRISDFIHTYYAYFMNFDVVKIYYDNGQAGVTKLIIAVFTALLSNTDIKQAAQKDYRLLQAADLICSAELIRLKMDAHTLSRSERLVLGTDREIQKNILKPLRKKEFTTQTHKK